MSGSDDSARLQPSIKVQFLRENFEALERLGEEHRAAVIERLPAGTRATLWDLPPTGWVDVALDVDLTLAIDEVAGRDALRAWARVGLASSLDAPFLRAMVQGATRLFGLDPGSFLRVLPRGMTSIYRDCGTFDFDRTEERCAVVTVRGAPASWTTTDAYLDGFAGALEALLALARKEGEGKLVDLDRLTGAATIELRWS